MNFRDIQNVEILGVLFVFRCRVCAKNVPCTWKHIVIPFMKTKSIDPD
jgi:hypothetical protein